ncbi:MAG TPA: transposase, partial [Kofleriaceae bacterium]
VHLLVPDGVFVADEDQLAFALHPVPTGADVLAILDRIMRRIARRLADEACDDRMEEGIDVLAQVQAEAAATWRSPHNGKPTVRGVERLRAWCVTSPSRSLHAGVVIADHDREALERLCRYGTRPAFAHDQLAWTAAGQIAYRLKRPWPDGRTELVLPPVAFLRRLCGIVPPPRRHLVRYAGVFGPASKRRAQLRALVPARGGEPPPVAPTPSGSTRAGRVPWAELLRRVFATDVLSCPCGGRRSVVAVVVDSARARAVFVALGLPCTPATFAPARDPPQGELRFDDAS